MLDIFKHKKEKLTNIYLIVTEIQNSQLFGRMNKCLWYKFDFITTKNQLLQILQFTDGIWKTCDLVL